MKSTQSALLLAAVLPIGVHALVIQPLPEVVTLPHDVKHKGLTIPAGSRIHYDTDRNAPKTDWQQVLQTEKIHSIYFPKNMVWGGYRTDSLSFYSGKISLFTATPPKNAPRFIQCNRQYSGNAYHIYVDSPDWSGLNAVFAGCDAQNITMRFNGKARELGNRTVMKEGGDWVVELNNTAFSVPKILRLNRRGELTGFTFYTDQPQNFGRCAYSKDKFSTVTYFSVHRSGNGWQAKLETDGHDYVSEETRRRDQSDACFSPNPLPAATAAQWLDKLLAENPPKPR